MEGPAPQTRPVVTVAKCRRLPVTATKAERLEAHKEKMRRKRELNKALSPGLYPGDLWAKIFA